MARPISDEELQLKKRSRRRLVGAIVLVSAVAVILPMVLDSEPKSVNRNVDIQIPSPDSGEFKRKGAVPSSSVAEGASKTGTVSKPDAAPKADASVAPTAVEPSTSAPSPSGADTPSAGAAVASKDAGKADSTEKARTSEGPGAEAAKSDATKGATVESVNTASASYVVQVAALSDAARVKQLQKQMAGVGVKTYTEVVSTKSGEVTRVRAGPYATREAAENARTQLKKAGLDGKVVAK